MTSKLSTEIKDSFMGFLGHYYKRWSKGGKKTDVTLFRDTGYSLSLSEQFEIWFVNVW